MKNKTIYIFIFGIIAVAILAGYYFGVFLPKDETKIITQQKQIPKIDLVGAVQTFEENIKKDYKAVAYSKLDNESNGDDVLIGEYKLEINNTGKNTFSIFRENKLVSTHDGPDAITEMGSLRLNNIDHYLLQSYSGGAHCCFTWRAMAHENGALHVGEKLDLMHTGEQIGKYYFEKDSQLYFLMHDSSLAEFHTSFAGSVFFPVFYRIDSKSANFVRSDNEFAQYYQQLADDINKEIETAKSKLADKIDFKKGNTTPTDELFSALTHRLIIRILANSDIETAKKEFISDSDYFFIDGMIEGEVAGSVADEVIKKVSSALTPDLVEANRKFKDSISKDYKEIAYAEKRSYWDNFEEIQTISAGEYDLKINNPKGDFFGNGGNGFLEIYKNSQLDRKLDYNWSIVGADNFKFKDADYLLLNRYAGGAGMYKKQFIVQDNGALRIGKEFYLMRSEIERTFEKDGQAYLWVSYSGFEYDRLGGQNWFPVFFGIDSQSANAVLSKKEFESYYQQLAGDIDSAVEKAKSTFGSKFDVKDNKVYYGQIYSVLAYQLVVTILAGDDTEIAKRQFVEDGKYFFKDGIIHADGTTAELAADHIIERVTSLDKEIEVPAKFL